MKSRDLIMQTYNFHNRHKSVQMNEVLMTLPDHTTSSKKLPLLLDSSDYETSRLPTLMEPMASYRNQELASYLIDSANNSQKSIEILPSLNTERDFGPNLQLHLP